MRRHLLGRAWRRAARRTPGTRYHHTHRPSDLVIIESAHIRHGIR